METPKDVNAAIAEIAKLETAAAEIHARIKELKKEKNSRTRRISALQAYVDAMREPNPISGGTIGL